MQFIPGSATVAISDRVAKKRAEGADILSFSLGEPDFTTPKHICDAAKAALDAGHTHYTPGPGIRALRDTIAATHKRENNIDGTGDQVLVTPTKLAVTLAMQALVNPGDEVLLPNPGWVSYAPCVQWAQGVGVEVDLDEAFRMTPDAVAEKITSKTKMIVMNSPSNPTGGVQEDSDIRGIVELAEDHDFWILSDEIYQKLRYDAPHLSAASMAPERTITLDGMSKAYAMTGWRVGWAIAPPEVYAAMNRLQSHSVTHVTSFAQYGALAGLQGPQDCVEEMRQAFDARRRLMLQGFKDLGIDCPTPRGAFYCFPNFGGDDVAWCEALIDAGVATTPGSSFGSRGKGHLRFSYAASEATITEGLARVARALN